MRPSTRRAFLSRGVRAAGLVAAGGLACDSRRPRAGFLGAMERVNERFQRALFDPQRLAPELDAQEQTAPAAFPQYRIGPGFPPAPPGWALEVGGLVREARTLPLDALRRLPRTDLRVRHHCVEGWTAVASWHGVRLSEIARAVGADPRARYVEFGSFEPAYYSCWDVESALHPQTILAYGMNGAELPREHGAPLRLYAGVKLGYKMVKWLLYVNFLPERTGGYWEDRGYEWFAGI